MGDGTLMGVVASSSSGAQRRDSARRRALPEFELVKGMDEFRSEGKKAKHLLAEMVESGVLEIETDDEGTNWYSLADEWADVEFMGPVVPS
jgi:hypothetical protein